MKKALCKFLLVNILAEITCSRESVGTNINYFTPTDLCNFGRKQASTDGIHQTNCTGLITNSLATKLNIFSSPLLVCLLRPRLLTVPEEFGTGLKFVRFDFVIIQEKWNRTSL